MKVKGKAGIVLTILAGIGMVVTIVLTAKKAPEAQKAKEAALEKKRQETGDENAKLTKLETLKAEAPCYAPVACSVAFATASLVGSQILPQRTIYQLEQWKNTYQDISAKVNGPKGENLISQMTDAKLQAGESGIKKEMFVLKYDQRNIIFETTLLDVFEAEYDANRFFTGTGELTFNQLLQLFHIDLKGDPIERGDEFGWNVYLGEAWYGYSWIDFNHRRGMLDGKPVTFIDMPFECHSLVEDDENYTNTFGSTIMNHGIEGTA